MNDAAQISTCRCMPSWCSSFLCGALPADAHLNSTGMGPFYDGLMHFLMSPEDIVPVLALALLAGLRGAATDGGLCSRFLLPGCSAGSSRICAADECQRPCRSLRRPGFSCSADCSPPTPKFRCA